MDKQILANWEEYATVKQWKRGLKINSYSNKLSEKTLESLRIWTPLFIEYSQKTPDQIIEESLNGKETKIETLTSVRGCNKRRGKNEQNSLFSTPKME